MNKFLILTLSLFFTSYAHSDWQTADRSSANIAPLPSETEETIVSDLS